MVRNVKEDDGFLLDQYYPSVAHLTIPTRFIQLTQQDKQAISALYRCSLMKQKVTPALNQSLVSLQNKIQAERKGLTSFFVRLNYRSPKDGTPQGYSLTKLYQNQLRRIGSGTMDQGNRQLRAYFATQDKAMRCSSAVQVINLLGSSMRINVDLLSHQQLSSKQKQPPVVLCIREWYEDMDGEFEFRCFVKNSTLRAISQYNHYIKLPHSTAHVVPAIQTYFYQQLRGCLQLKDYVFDVLVLPQKIVLIELNPLLPSTGPGLFRWEEQILALSEYCGPVQFRVVQIVDDEHQREMAEMTVAQYFQQKRPDGWLGWTGQMGNTGCALV